MTSREIAKKFEKLPAESLPQCYGDDPSDEPQDVRMAVHLIASGKVASGMVFSDKITLLADRDEWRNGVVIEV